MSTDQSFRSLLRYMQLRDYWAGDEILALFALDRFSNVYLMVIFSTGSSGDETES